MSKKETIVLGILTILLIGLGSGSAFAEESWAEVLDLDRQQIKELRKEKRYRHALLQELRAQRSETKRNLEHELLSDKPDEKHVDRLKTDLLDIDRKIVDERVDAVRHTRDLLTDAQRERLDKKLEKKHNKKKRIRHNKATKKRLKKLKRKHKELSQRLKTKRDRIKQREHDYKARLRDHIDNIGD